MARHIVIMCSLFLVSSPVAAQRRSATVRRSVAVPQQARHRVLHLAGNAEGVSQAVAALRQYGKTQFAAPAYRTLRDGVGFLLVNQLDIEFKPGTSRTQIDALNQKIGAIILLPPVPDSGFIAWRVELLSGRDPIIAAQQASIDAIVEWADISKIPDYAPLHVPADPYYSLQFHLKNTSFYNGVSVDLNLEPAWDLTRGDGLVEIAIIDDGVDWLHGNVGGGFTGDMHSGQFNGGSADYVPASGDGDPPLCQ